MGLLDKLSVGMEKVAKEAEKAFDQGKVKVDQLQLERQMDTAARKLGYLEFDRSRGRAADDAVRASLLADLERMEAQHVALSGTPRGPDDDPGAATSAATPAPEAAAPDAGPAPVTETDGALGTQES
jgi:hypothetical protein